MEMAERQTLMAFRSIATRSGAMSRQSQPPLLRLEQCRRYTQRRNTSPGPLVSRIHAPKLRSSRGTSPTFHPLPRQPHSHPFSTTTPHHHGDLTPPKPGQERHVTFVDKDNSRHTFEVGDGDNLLDIAQANDLEMEGACGGSCACSTCHIIVEGDDMYDKMEEPSDDENDMLDLAFGLTETSRLGCQVSMSRELDGLVVSYAYYCTGGITSLLISHVCRSNCRR